MGIPRTAEGRERFAELCAALSTHAGIYIIPYIAPSYRELAKAVTLRRVAFAWLPPLQLIELADRGVVVNLAIPVRHGTTSYFSALIVHRDGPQTIAELRGKRAAWVDRDSASGYLAVKLNLLAQRIDPETYFASQTFLGSHDAVVDSLLSGRADCGATYCVLDLQTVRQLSGAFTLADGRAARPVRVLKTVGPIANDSLAASSEVHPEDRRAFQEALLSMHGRTAELFVELLRADSFRAADDAHYAPLRRLLEAVKQHPET